MILRISTFIAIAFLATNAIAGNAPRFHDEFAKAAPVALAAQTENKAAGIPTGEPLIVQFWASWCVGCRSAMESSIKKLDTNDLKVGFINISLDEDPAAARNYLKPAGPLAERLTAAAFVDTRQKLAESLNIKAVPATLFINRDGSVAGQLLGHGSPVEFERLFRQISQAH
jgi:thiol-disulfide isomerase/thioredoxin